MEARSRTCSQYYCMLKRKSPHPSSSRSPSIIIKTIQTLSPWPRLCPSCHAFTLLPDRLSLFRQLTCATNCTLRFALGQQQTQCFFLRPSAPLRLPTADGPNLLPSMSHVRRVQMMKPHSDCLGARANSDAFTSAVFNCHYFSN
jgi:hypothetical protein